jgi:hypothetical protein
MTWSAVEILTAPHWPELCRQVCAYAGLPTQARQATTDRFIIRCGSEPPEMLAKLLEEALPEDAPEIQTRLATDTVDSRRLAPGEIVVQAGFALPAPISEELWQSVRGGRVLVLAIERHGAQGALQGVVWTALSEEPHAGDEPLRAAVARELLEPGPDQ